MPASRIWVRVYSYEYRSENTFVGEPSRVGQKKKIQERKWLCAQNVVCCEITPTEEPWAVGRSMKWAHVLVSGVCPSRVYPGKSPPIYLPPATPGVLVCVPW